MAKISLFGGITPSIAPRSLSPDSAQIAQNLDMRFGDFRPAKGLGASVTAVANGAMSVFRPPSGAWLSSAADTDYVLGQIQDSAVERVYYTSAGSPPKTYQASGISPATRDLGVAAPTTAVTIDKVAVGEFTSQESTTGRSAVPDQVAQIFKDSLTSSLLGSPSTTPPTSSTTGWLAHGVAGTPTKSPLQASFCVPMTLVGGAYVMLDADSNSFLLDPGFAGVQLTYASNVYWAVPVYVYGQGQTINTVYAKAQMQLVMSPADIAVRLWTDAEIDSILAFQVSDYDTAKQPIKGLVDAVNVGLQGLSKVYDTATTLVSLKAAMTAFFLRTEVAAALLVVRGPNGGVGSPSAGGSGGTFCWEVAGRAYNFGSEKANNRGTANVAATSFFNPGADTTSYANIRALYDSCLITDRRNATTFDRSKLAAALSEAFMAIVNLRTGDDKWTKASVDGAVEYCLGILDKVFADTNWAKNTAWPYNQSINSKSVAAAISARDVLKAACEDIGLAYESLKKSKLSYIANTMYDSEILVKLPKPVDRIGESRCYIYTYVTDLKEESAPSPASIIVDCDQNDTITVTAPAPPSGKNIRKIRLYRSSTSNSATAFQFVIENSAEISDAGWATLSNRQLVDTFRQEALGEVCPSTNWDAPPATGVGLISLPNGIMVMFDGVRVRPSEPFIPYAFPIDYEQTMDYAYVGAGVFGQTAVILTTGNPYYMSGADSASMTLQKIESNQSCISKRSVHGGEGGVFFVSPDGICLAGPSGVVVLTEGVYSREDWNALNPGNSIGRYIEGIYYLFLLSSSVCLALDLKSKRISTMSLTTTGAYADLATDTLYIVQGTSLQPMFRGSLLTGKWRSKKMAAGGYWGFSCAKVESDFEAAPVTLRLYGEGALFYTATFNARDPQRLPDFRVRDLEIEIESTSRVTAMWLTNSMMELIQ